MAGKKKKKLFTKNAVRAVAFLCLIALVVLGCNEIFCFADAEHSETVMNEFYELKPGETHELVMAVQSVPDGGEGA